ncbi:hypothetical protein D3C81_2335770 [compost metagenome]
MNGMLIFPLVIGKEGEDSRYRSYNGIRFFPCEKGLMTAIMENNEDSDQKSGSWNG